jgi:transposase
MDNLQVHKTNEVKAAYERLNIIPVFNIPYSPDFNGIESYFSMVKGNYKKLLLQLMMKEQTFNVVELIKQSINAVADVKVRRCVTSGLDAVAK